MKQKTRSILVVSLWLFVGVIVYQLNVSEVDKPKAPWTTDAVVECQEAVEKKLYGAKVSFDNAFKYEGTKEIVKGIRFQVTGKINVGKLQKNYGCFVVFKKGKPSVEVVL